MLGDLGRPLSPLPSPQHEGKWGGMNRYTERLTRHASTEIRSKDEIYLPILTYC